MALLNCSFASIFVHDRSSLLVVLGGETLSHGQLAYSKTFLKIKPNNLMGNFTQMH